MTTVEFTCHSDIVVQNGKFSILTSLLLQYFNVAKCNLGKVNLEAMLSSNLWMQEARLQPWRFAGALCDTYTQ